MIEKLQEFARLAKRVSGGRIVSVLYHGVKFASMAFREHISMVDYFELSLYKKSRAERQTYIVRYGQTDFAYAIDPFANGKEFTKKTTQYGIFKEQMGREQLFAEEMTLEEFLAFAQRHDRFLYKPDYSWCGEGIRLINLADWPDREALYKTLAGTNAVLDELLIQHEAMENLFSGSLNTVRVFSIVLGGEVNIIAAALRMGRTGSIVDNYSAGGVVCSLDLETGKVLDRGEDMYGNRYDAHPDSGTELVGYSLPNWDKVIALVKQAAQISSIRYVGWDIAIRQDDCVLVEANYNPMVNVVQIAGASGKERCMTSLWSGLNRNSKTVLKKMYGPSSVLVIIRLFSP